jgi:hypothetical protein
MRISTELTTLHELTLLCPVEIEAACDLLLIILSQVASS